MEILSTFHTQVEYISGWTIRRSAWSECTQTYRQKWKQYIRQFHSVYLADMKITNVM